MGPQALKPLLFAPHDVLWTSAAGSDGGITFHPKKSEALPTAVIGVRACDLAALRLQDQHFLEGPFPDPHYGARRRNLFLVAETLDLDRDDETLRQQAKMVIRNYDPCISCATHFLTVRVERR